MFQLILVFLWVFALLVMPTLGLIGFVILFWRPSGRLNRVRRDDYLRDPPSDLPPALVAMLFMSTPGYEGMTATLLDLVRRDVVRMKAATADRPAGTLLFRDDTLLSFDPAATALTRPFERQVLYLVFMQERREITVAEMRDWWVGHEMETEHWYASWSAAVSDEAMALGLLRGDPRRWLVGAFVYGIAVAGVSVMAAPLLGFGALTGFVTGLLLSLLGSRHVSPLTPRGARLRAQYVRLRNYLRDFGRLDEKPPEGVAVWDTYLPLAMVLGQGEAALRLLDVTGSSGPFTPLAHDPVRRLDLGDILKPRTSSPQEP